MMYLRRRPGRRPGGQERRRSLRSFRNRRLVSVLTCPGPRGTLSSGPFPARADHRLVVGHRARRVIACVPFSPSEHAHADGGRPVLPARPGERPGSHWTLPSSGRAVQRFRGAIACGRRQAGAAVLRFGALSSIMARPGAHLQRLEERRVPESYGNLLSPARRAGAPSRRRKERCDVRECDAAWVRAVLVCGIVAALRREPWRPPRFGERPRAEHQRGSGAADQPWADRLSTGPAETQGPNRYLQDIRDRRRQVQRGPTRVQGHGRPLAAVTAKVQAAESRAAGAARPTGTPRPVNEPSAARGSAS